MADVSLLVLSALVSGAWLSLALLIIMVVSGRLAMDMWVGDYPPDIQQKYGRMSARGARLRPYVAVAFFAAALAIPIVGLFGLEVRLGRVTFLPAFLFSGVTLLVFNVFDLLILDWLLFCTVQPRWIVLPGTEGMAAYRDYRFHFIGFLKGLGFCAVGGLLVSGIWTALQLLLR
jgi:hypothetical protein